ncbi:MAG: NAD/NADP octopine/nopaline dehydrogenase family protein [Bacteroidales bacterium]|nr:NAD/NADP octopine/nopaline dehydrogenase family protein [Bacteroidales bacterium]MBQ9214541.1 NAD/NADP octopine/nopaline dehydrogenase family protein [Bacteroidales bacterium]
MLKVCICGGGALGHVCAGVLSSEPNVSVNVLTGKPNLWNKDIEVFDCNSKTYSGRINQVSNLAQDVITNADIVFLCLPGYAIERELETIKPYLSEKTVIGSIVCSTGFFFFAHRILGIESKLFGFQRTPFIARVKEYGKSANLLGYKSEVAIATENISGVEDFRKIVETLWRTPVKLLDNFYEVSLTNSNPILHTGRLYSMFFGLEDHVFDHNIMFYDEWTDDASETIIKMDAEFFLLLDKLQVRNEAIPPLLSYYESFDAKSLTQKIRSIKAFHGITSPMVEAQNGWIVDFKNRYFTEDFPYGLKHIWELSKHHGIDIPMIDKVYKWGMKVIK